MLDGSSWMLRLALSPELLFDLRIRCALAALDVSVQRARLALLEALLLELAAILWVSLGLFLAGALAFSRWRCGQSRAWIGANLGVGRHPVPPRRILGMR